MPRSPQLCDDGHEPIAYRPEAVACPLCAERAGRPLPARVDGPWEPISEYDDRALIAEILQTVNVDDVLTYVEEAVYGKRLTDDNEAHWVGALARALPYGFKVMKEIS